MRWSPHARSRTRRVRLDQTVAAATGNRAVIPHLESSRTGCHVGRPEYHRDMAPASSCPGQTGVADKTYRHRRFVMHNPELLKSIEHGDRCDCKVLALAVWGASRNTHIFIFLFIFF